MSLTDIHLGWVELQACRNNARTHILAGLEKAHGNIPYLIQGIDCDNGSEFINHDVVAWAGEKDIFFTRSRPYRKNDQAHIESKNNHVVRKYAFHYRYDTPEELALLAKLYTNVCLKMNYFTPTVKPIGWKENKNGRRKRVYDNPATPYQRLKAAGILSTAQQDELESLYQSINPAELTREITRLQSHLIGHAREKTETLTIGGRPETKTA